MFSFVTFTKYLFRFNTIQTLWWYFFSAWWFSEIYIWSASDQVNLAWLVKAGAWETKRLNERPIYLRSVFFILALLQTYLHLYYDYDRAFLPTIGRSVQSPSTYRAHIILAPLEQLKIAAPSLIQRVLLRATCVGIISPFIYAMFIRRTAWSWALFLARMLWEMPAAVDPSYLPPYHISLLLRSLGSGFLLIFLWESSNTIFSAFVAQEPLKNGQPLTDESRDANGTLLNGLKARKEVVKAFALWELVYISQRFENRRRLLFADIDRAGGPAWAQVLSACMTIIQGITERINESQNPSPKPLPPQQQAHLQCLPRISAPMRETPVFRNSLPPTTLRGSLQSSIGTIAKSYGQSPSSSQPSSPLTPRTKQHLGVVRNKLLTLGQQQAFSPSVLRSSVNDCVVHFLRSPLGRLFRQTFQRRVRTVVLGSPNSQFGQIIDAVDALSSLAVASLKEDMYGTVSKDVVVLIRTYANTITTLEAFVSGVAVHWTDVEFHDRKVDEVDLILASLRGGLREIIRGFGPYAEELEISEQEMNAARMVVGMTQGGT
ncbi:hypothetical protein MMC07_007011 [Pseudocyphellaria aurata]|nr:hypothetical protein [Pseudocyphellaria aurata]